MIRAAKLLKLQLAADEIGTLAEIVGDLGALLDRIHSEIGEEMYSRVREAFPLADKFGPKTNAELIRLANQVVFQWSEELDRRRDDAMEREP